jgi:NAD(P)-dependent dehydrogenase (short-subunit alcohol dehydrogenase family)
MKLGAGKTMKILITGAGRGLGYALAAEALERGHSVIAGVRNEGGRHGGLLELAGRHPGRVVIAGLDVADEPMIAGAASNLKRQGVVVDAIVNNAAILLARDASIENLDFGLMSQTMDINLYGPMRIVKHFLPLMSSGGARCIINISSEAGSFTNAYGGDYPYAISKAALNMFSRQLNKLLKDRDIPVYAVHPGWIKTEMGGERAPGDPVVSARGIMDLLERKTTAGIGDVVFIDYSGKAMPI